MTPPTTSPKPPTDEARDYILSQWHPWEPVLTGLRGALVALFGPSGSCTPRGRARRDRIVRPCVGAVDALGQFRKFRQGIESASDFASW